MDEAVICLNCGCSVNRPYTASKPILAEESESQLATWSMICGVVSFFIGWFVLGVTAIVLAVMSKAETDGEMSPSAKAGYICGIISTILSFVIIVFIMFVMVAGM